MSRVGIFGGSFDPVHFGHIYLAEDAMVQAGLEKIIFVPTRTQPFKQHKKATDSVDRLEMLTLALGDDERFKISDFEINNSGVSYTYLTLRHLKEKLGEDTVIFFITGSDSFYSIEKWRNAEELLDNYNFIVGVRPGYPEEELDKIIEGIREKHGTEIIKIDNRKFNISSTEVRERAATGYMTNDLIPPEVEEYIQENHLYDPKDD